MFLVAVEAEVLRLWVLSFRDKEFSLVKFANFVCLYRQFRAIPSWPRAICHKYHRLHSESFELIVPYKIWVDQLSFIAKGGKLSFYRNVLWRFLMKRLDVNVWRWWPNIKLLAWPHFVTLLFRYTITALFFPVIPTKRGKNYFGHSKKAINKGIRIHSLVPIRDKQAFKK